MSLEFSAPQSSSAICFLLAAGTSCLVPVACLLVICLSARASKPCWACCPGSPQTQTSRPANWRARGPLGLGRLSLLRSRSPRDASRSERVGWDSCDGAGQRRPAPPASSQSPAGPRCAQISCPPHGLQVPTYDTSTSSLRGVRGAPAYLVLPAGPGKRAPRSRARPRLQRQPRRTGPARPRRAQRRLAEPLRPSLT